MKNLKLFEEYLNDNERIIVVLVDTVADIEDELSFFHQCYEKLISENEKLKNKDLTVFLNVQATLSSGNGLYKIKNGEIKETDNNDWEKVINYLNKVNIKTSEDFSTSEEIEKYFITL